MEVIFFLFIFCAVLGWVMEVFYRSYLFRRFYNPGLLYGPYLPVYGFAGIIMYAVYISEVNVLLKILFLITVPTILEFIGGIIFVKYFKIKLWDYSKVKFNYAGVICLGYSILWAVLSLGFYYILDRYHPVLTFLSSNSLFVYIIGFVYLIIIFDAVLTFYRKVFHKIRF